MRVPRYAREEFEDYLACGMPEHGFALLRCEGCGTARAVAFSCEHRGFCPSCIGRRMNQGAAHLVDNVFPRAPVRQCVLSLPMPLRFRLAWDGELKFKRGWDDGTTGIVLTPHQLPYGPVRLASSLRDNVRQTCFRRHGRLPAPRGWAGPLVCARLVAILPQPRRNLTHRWRGGVGRVTGRREGLMFLVVAAALAGKVVPQRVPLGAVLLAQRADLAEAG